MPGEASETRIKELETIVERDPSTALYLPLAERLRDAGRVEDAIRLCETRKTRPGRGVGDAVVLGRCYLADGRLSDARAEFETALGLDRENVVALKALAGILTHEGRHARAVELYRAVCRIDPGDLESQTALHQITSGEFAEVFPADVVVGQGDLGWQPVRLPREEEHLADLAMGLRMIENLDTPTPTVEPERVRDFREFSLDDLDRKAPAAPPAPPASEAPATPAPFEAAPAGPTVPPTLAGASPLPVATDAAGPEASAPASSEAIAPASPEEPAPEPVSAERESARARVEPSGPASSWPAAQTPEPAGGAKPAESAHRHGVSGNRSAFEDWLRRLGGGS